MVGPLLINVLGELALERDGRSVPLPHSRKTRALLAYLAVVGRSVRRDHLCELLWDVPDDPRASLRWSLHKIRQIVNAEDEVLSTTRDHVLLEPKKVDVDFRSISAANDLKALEAGTLQTLANSFGKTFLEDLALPRCPKFEAWRQFHSRAAIRMGEQIVDELRARTGAGHASDTAGGGAPALELRISPDTTATRTKQDIHYCVAADGVRIAYALSGSGRPLVRAAHWMSHLQYDLESPVWRHWIDALSDTGRLCRYDQRTNGLSDWDTTDVSFESMVGDLESVVDAAGLDRFTLLGLSQSCAISVAYAVRHPERLSGLILYGGFVKGWMKRADSHEIAIHQAMATLIREGWGKNKSAFREFFTRQFLPDATAEQIAWFNDLQRATVSPDNAVRLHEAFGQIDVSDCLGRVSTPTLVLHAARDAVAPLYAGKQFALGIPGARFVELDSANHILLGHEPAFHEFCAQIGRFVRAVERP